MVLCNLKARNMRGIKSDGMLLCASNDTHEVVEPLMPPEDAKCGERVAYGDDETAAQPEPETPNKVIHNFCTTLCHCWKYAPHTSYKLAYTTQDRQHTFAYCCTSKVLAGRRMS